MIDFKNASFFKLKPVDSNTYSNVLTPMFVNGEEIIATFKSIRDGVVFTNKRIIAINVQGLTGTKKDFSSLQDILTKHGVTARITALQPVNEGAALV